MSSSPLAIATASHRMAPVTLTLLRICNIITRLSAALSAAFGGSRAIFALATQRQAPCLFALRDGQGRLLISLVIAVSLALLGFTALSKLPQLLLIYVVDSGGFPILFIHLTIFVAHVRFRRGLRKQGRAVSCVKQVWSTGLIGSYFGIVFNSIVIFCQLWTALAPTGYSETLSVQIMGLFFMSYVYIPVLMILYIGYKLRCRTKWRRSAEIDYSTFMTS